MRKIGPALRNAFVILLGAGLIAATTVAASAETVRVAVGIDPGYVSFFVAHQSKIFEKFGLEVSLTQFPQGGDAIDSVAAGVTDISAAAEPTVMIRMARSDMRAVVITAQSSTYLKLAVSSGIGDIHQIKKYGMVPGGVGEYLSIKGLQKNNIPLDSVSIVRSGPPELPALLSRGDIDGFWLFEPFPSIAARQGGKILMNSGDVGYTYTFWVAAKASWLQQNQSTAHKLVGALAEACTQVRADPQLGAAATQAEVKIPTSQTLDFLKQVQCVVRDFTLADFTSFDDIADVLASRKITPQRVDYRKSLDVGFYKP